MGLLDWFHDGDEAAHATSVDDVTQAEPDGFKGPAPRVSRAVQAAAERVWRESIADAVPANSTQNIDLNTNRHIAGPRTEVMRYPWSTKNGSCTIFTSAALDGGSNFRELLEATEATGSLSPQTSAAITELRQRTPGFDDALLRVTAAHEATHCMQSKMADDLAEAEADGAAAFIELGRAYRSHDTARIAAVRAGLQFVQLHREAEWRAGHADGLGAFVVAKALAADSVWLATATSEQLRARGVDAAKEAHQQAIRNTPAR